MGRESGKSASNRMGHGARATLCSRSCCGHAASFAFHFIAQTSFVDWRLNARPRHIPVVCTSAHVYVRSGGNAAIGVQMIQKITTPKTKHIGTYVLKREDDFKRNPSL